MRHEPGELALPVVQVIVVVLLFLFLLLRLLVGLLFQQFLAQLAQILTIVHLVSNYWDDEPQSEEGEKHHTRSYARGDWDCENPGDEL